MVGRGAVGITSHSGLNGSTVRYSVITFGCRVNQADSLGIEEALRSRGAVSAASAEADLIVVNTCSVTSSADQGARQAVRRIARENPTARRAAIRYPSPPPVLIASCRRPVSATSWGSMRPETSRSPR